MASKPEYDDLLDDDEDSQVFDADEELEFTPRPDENAGVVAAEPPIISIGRKNRKDVMRSLPPEQG